MMEGIEQCISMHDRGRLSLVRSFFIQNDIRKDENGLDGLI